MPGLSEAKGAAPGPVGWFVGLATLDVIQLVDVLPAPNQKTTAKQTWLAAGGPATVGKLVAARRLSLPVVMVERPPKPDVETVDHIDQVLPWLVAQGLFVTERGV